MFTPTIAAAHASITVVVPTYNRARLIEQTLNAILDQTMPAQQILVIDDGSTDDTTAVLAQYGDRLTPVRIVNSGDLAARNTGLRAAYGDLVAFCDSDDIWTPDFLSTMSQQWRDEPDLLACYSNFRVLNEDALSAGSKFDDAPEDFWLGLRTIGQDRGVFDCPITERLLIFQPLFPSCMMTSRAAFLRLGGWDEGVSRLIGGDFATALRVANAPPVGILRKPLVAIRKHAGNYSGQTEMMNLGDAAVLDYVLQTRPELGAIAGSIRKSIASRRMQALDSAFSRRDFTAVLEIGRRVDPAHKSSRTRLKIEISRLPQSMRRLFAAAVSR